MVFGLYKFLNLFLIFVLFKVIIKKVYIKGNKYINLVKISEKLWCGIEIDIFVY